MDFREQKVEALLTDHADARLGSAPSPPELTRLAVTRFVKVELFTGPSRLEPAPPAERASRHPARDRRPAVGIFTPSPEARHVACCFFLQPAEHLSAQRAAAEIRRGTRKSNLNSGQLTGLSVGSVSV